MIQVHQSLPDGDTMPRHIAIIMDGNSRWAKKRSLTRKAGHKAGAEALQRVTEDAIDLGIKYLTVYAFSTENWKRSDEEVKGIMDLLRHYLKEHIRTAAKRNVIVKVIGERSRLDTDIQLQIHKLEDLTKDKTGITLIIALNYGGRDEIIRATQKIAAKVQTGELSAADIQEDLFQEYLDTNNIPDPEIVIRTSGERRISNFLLWQMAYSQLVFSQKLWPDFTTEDLKEAIAEFQNADRRFGGRNS